MPEKVNSQKANRGFPVLKNLRGSSFELSKFCVLVNSKPLTLLIYSETKITKGVKKFMPEKVNSHKANRGFPA